MEFKPVKRASISEQVFNQLKQKVLEGEWTQGEKLPSENELADKLGVSRVTIRQGLQKLVALGLAETRLGEGTFVRELTPGTLMQSVIPVAYLSARTTMEVLDFRYVIEVETAALAAERCQPEDVEMLRNQLDTMLAAKGDFWAFSRADLDFHLMIAQITRNSMIVETYTILRDVLEACMKETVESLGVELGIPYHKRLIEYFEKKDPEAAKECMRAHMISTRNEFERALKDKSKA